ncbi:hypothetical protein BG015_003199, partial [Linnemannia schmuckeri]
LMLPKTDPTANPLAFKAPITLVTTTKVTTSTIARTAFKSLHNRKQTRPTQTSGSLSKQMMFKFAPLAVVILALAAAAQAASVTFTGCHGQTSVQDLNNGQCYSTREWRRTDLCRVQSDYCILYSDSDCREAVADGSDIDARHVTSNDSIMCE